MAAATGSAPASASDTRSPSDTRANSRRSTPACVRLSSNRSSTRPAEAVALHADDRVVARRPSQDRRPRHPRVLRRPRGSRRVAFGGRVTPRRRARDVSGRVHAHGHARRASRADAITSSSYSRWSSSGHRLRGRIEHRVVVAQVACDLDQRAARPSDASADDERSQHAHGARGDEDDGEGRRGRGRSGTSPAPRPTPPPPRARARRPSWPRSAPRATGVAARRVRVRPRCTRRVRCRRRSPRPRARRRLAPGRSRR